MYCEKVAILPPWSKPHSSGITPRELQLKEIVHAMSNSFWKPNPVPFTPLGEHFWRAKRGPCRLVCFFFIFLCRWLLGEKNNTNINTLKTHGTWGCVENFWKCFFSSFFNGVSTGLYDVKMALKNFERLCDTLVLVASCSNIAYNICQFQKAL